MRSIKSSGVWNCLFVLARGVGNRPPRKKKVANPRAGLQPLFSILRRFLETEIIDKTLGLLLPGPVPQKMIKFNPRLSQILI